MREKYFAKGQACKVAMSFGQDPLIYLAGGIEVPHGLSEYDWIGGVQGGAVPVIKGEYTGLPIPAYSEIVVEGEALPDQKLPEGPFGEWTGYYASSVRPEPLIKVKRLYHRSNPIILGAPPTRPRSEEHTSELQSHSDLVCRLLLEKKNKTYRKSKSMTAALESIASTRTSA